MKLSQRNVVGLTLPDGERDKNFWDDELKGFGFRLRSNGRGSWIVQYRFKGRQRKRKIGDYAKITADKARAEATRVLAEVALGRDPQSEREAQRSAKTLIAVATAYLDMKEMQVERGQYRAASLYVTRLYLTGKQYFGPLHNVPLTDITVADVALRVNAINRDSGTITASRARAALRAFYVWAMQQGLMGPQPYNPVAATENPGDVRPRDLVLSDLELAEIWRATDDGDFGKIVKLLMLTACRRSEIGGLKWSEVDRDAGTITLPSERVKNGHAHSLPITSSMAAIFDSVPHIAGRDHLFGERSATGFAGWVRAKQALDDRLTGKLENKSAAWSLHDIRRSVSTWMAEHGVLPHVIEAILNHWTGHRSGVAGVYNRAQYAPMISSALNLWDDHLRSLLDGGERKIVPFAPPAA